MAYRRELGVSQFSVQVSGASDAEQILELMAVTKVELADRRYHMPSSTICRNKLH